jgi:hypothetical protein
MSRGRLLLLKPSLRSAIHDPREKIARKPTRDRWNLLFFQAKSTKPAKTGEAAWGQKGVGCEQNARNHFPVNRLQAAIFGMSAANAVKKYPFATRR